MSSRRGWAGGVVLGLALASTGCDVKVGEDGGLSVDFAAGRATDEWVRTYDIRPGGRLDIINVNGQIEVSPSSGGQVEVRALREVRSNSEEASREMLEKAAMREEVAPDRVSIQGPEEQERGRGFRGSRLTIRYQVRIPPGLNLLFKTQNGEVRLENVQGVRISASTTNGGVSGRNLSGAIEATTVNGGIQMDLDAVTGETRMTTVNGGVRLTVAPGVNADLEATVVNGGISIEDGFPLSGDERSRQRVAGRIGSGGPRLVVQTTNGGVRVGSRGAPGS
jgi:bifunctional DNA-binding transcriptional regulator/antitoxin component of YhaV-PrlF toxin-antitoxin module